MAALVTPPNSILSHPGYAGLAHLDPGSEGFPLQLFIARPLGAALAVRVSWGRLKGTFRLRDGVPPDSDSHEEHHP